jgi:phosphoribosylaminoimidazole-succinocarboxamide synthase
MSDEIITVDSFRKWTKEHLKGLKGLEKQLTKNSTDIEVVVKELDGEGWKAFRKKARALKGQSRTPASWKNRVAKEAARDIKRFTKILEHLQEK